MKPLSFNLKNAKKIAGDDKTSTFVVGGGHQIEIKHKLLPPIQRKQLQRIPVKMADGGEVPDDQPQATDWDAPASSTPVEPTTDDQESSNYDAVGDSTDYKNQQPSAVDQDFPPKDQPQPEDVDPQSIDQDPDDTRIGPDASNIGIPGGTLVASNSNNIPVKQKMMADKQAPDPIQIGFSPDGREIWQYPDGSTKFYSDDLQRNIDGGITRSEAENTLRSDIDEFSKVIDNKVKVPLTMGQRSALISHAFNTGPNGAGLNQAIKLINSGSDDDKVLSALDKDKNLYGRRDREADLYTGDSSTPLIDFLKKEEGFRPNIYDDRSPDSRDYDPNNKYSPKSKATTGYGHNLSDRVPDFDARYLSKKNDLLKSKEADAINKLQIMNTRSAPPSQSIMLAKGGMVQKFADGTPDEPINDSNLVDQNSLPEYDPNDPGLYSKEELAQPINNKNSIPSKIGMDQSGQTTISPVDELFDPSYDPNADASGMLSNTQNSQLPAKNVSSIELPSDQPSGDDIGQVPGQSGQGNLPNFVNVNDLYNQGISAIKQQQDIDQEVNPANQVALENDLQAKKNLQTQLQKSLFNIDQERSMVLNNLPKINPREYLDNMSTGQKIATGIGLFLGGFSMPFTHQGNPAMEFLNKQIDRNIQAQKDNFGKQKTMLEEYNKQFGDMTSAELAARIAQNDIFGQQIKLNAVKMGTAQALQNSTAAQSALGFKTADLRNQLAIRQTVLNAAKQNGGAGIDAIDLAHAGMMTPEEATKEQAAINGRDADHLEANNIFSELQQQQKPGQLMNPQSYSRVNALEARATNLILKNDRSGRLTPEAVKQEIDPLFTGRTNTQQTVNAKLNDIHALIDQNYGGQYPNMQKYAPAAIKQYTNVPQQSGIKAGSTVIDKRTGRQGIVQPNGDVRAVK